MYCCVYNNTSHDMIIIPSSMITVTSQPVIRRSELSDRLYCLQPPATVIHTHDLEM